MGGIRLAGAGFAEAHHAALAAGLLAHQEVQQQGGEQNGDDERHPFRQPGGLRRKLGGEAEGVVRGAHAVIEQVFVDLVDILIEAVGAGDDDIEVVGGGEIGIRDLAVLLQSI